MCTNKYTNVEFIFIRIDCDFERHKIYYTRDLVNCLRTNNAAPPQEEIDRQAKSARARVKERERANGKMVVPFEKQLCAANYNKIFQFH